MFRKINRQQVSNVPHLLQHRAGLASRGGAQVQHIVSRFGPGQQGNRLTGRILIIKISPAEQ